MSETRWTPGPWRVGKPGEKTGTLNMVIGPDNKMTAFTGNPARDAAEIAGNAHLTAAAPELYEALKWALPQAIDRLEIHRLERLQHKHHDIQSVDAAGRTIIGLWQNETDDIDRARAALAKARGE